MDRHGVLRQKLTKHSAEFSQQCGSEPSQHIVRSTPSGNHGTLDGCGVQIVATEPKPFTPSWGFCYGRECWGSLGGEGEGDAIGAQVPPRLHLAAKPLLQLLADGGFQVRVVDQTGIPSIVAEIKVAPGGAYVEVTRLGTQRLLTSPRPSPLSTRIGSSTGGRSAAKYKHVTLRAAGGCSSPSSLDAAGLSVATTIPLPGELTAVSQTHAMLFQTPNG